MVDITLPGVSAPDTRDTWGPTINQAFADLASASGALGQPVTPDLTIKAA